MDIVHQKVQGRHFEFASLLVSPMPILRVYAADSFLPLSALERGATVEFCACGHNELKFMSNRSRCRFHSIFNRKSWVESEWNKISYVKFEVLQQYVYFIYF